MDKHMKDSNHTKGQWVHYIRIFHAKLSKKARAFVIVYSHLFLVSKFLWLNFYPKFLIDTSVN